MSQPNCSHRVEDKGEPLATCSIIVPVYGAAAELADCLRSVVLHTDLRRHRLLLVLDGPQDAAVEAVLTQVPQAQLLRLPLRRGFVATVNHGMRACTDDVLLLNSDTQVSAGWLQQLTAAAYSAPRVGTVTPLSNNGSLCSVPRTLVENLLPAGHDVISFAALVRRVAIGTPVRIPTAVGFCMYIRRQLLQQIGLFDEQRFGLGYGEENDFCMRASAQGWEHVADDATFVLHLGHRSFRAERFVLQQQGWRTLCRLHPHYPQLIADFMQADPLAPVRQRIEAELQVLGRHSDGIGPACIRSAAPATGVMHVLHGWPPFAVAGTELYAHWLVRQQLAHRNVAVYARHDDPARGQGELLEYNDHGARVRLRVNHFRQRNPLARNSIHSGFLQRDFAAFLREQAPQLVHIHHLSGHALGLAGVARGLGIPVVLQLHDWWLQCARVNLLHADGRRCAGPALRKCARCYPLTGITPAPLWNPLLHALRQQLARRALRQASAYVMGSHAIAGDFQRAGLLKAGVPVHVLSYGVAITAGRELRQPARLPLRFGFIGAALPHKGLQIARAAFAGIDPALATLNVYGSAGRTFSEADKPQVLAEIDVLLLPSLGLESFGLVAREAMARGVPVIAAADGALLELPDAQLFDSGDPLMLRSLILRLAADPASVDAWSARLSTVKHSSEHAQEIEAVYAQVLRAQRVAERS